MSTHHPLRTPAASTPWTTTTVVTEPVPEYESLKSAAAVAPKSRAWTLREQDRQRRTARLPVPDKPGSAIRLRRADVDALFKPAIPKPTTSIVPGGDVAGFRLPQRLSLSEFSAERGSRLHAYLQVSALQRNRVQ